MSRQMPPLERAYEKMPGSIFNDTLKNEVFNLLASSGENASDCGVSDPDEWDALAFRTLCGALCDRGTSNAACEWFKAQGVNF